MKFIILLICASLSFNAYSQKNDNRDFDPPLLTRGIGVSIQAFDGLNSRLEGHPEFRKLRDIAGTLSLGCMKIRNRFVSNVDLVAASSMSGDRDRKSSTVRYLGAGIDLGYDVIPADKIILTPLVGIGGEAYMARFYRDNSAVPFNLVLVSPDVQNDIRPVDFTNTFFVYRLGFALATRHPNNRSVTFGIQARYVGSFKDKAWKSADNQELAGAPEDRLSQFQISLFTSGMPRFMKRK